MLEIRGLSAAIEEKPILQGIDLTVPQGEVHAIMGPNGSGKSTLAYVLSGREDYVVTAGSVTFDGHDLLRENVERLEGQLYRVEVSIADGAQQRGALEQLISRHRKQHALGDSRLVVPRPGSEGIGPAGPRRCGVRQHLGRQVRQPDRAWWHRRGRPGATGNR